jgi:general secretion pathway protein D
MSLSFRFVRSASPQPRLPRAWQRAALVASCALTLLLGACANQAIDEARKLSDQGHNEAALNTLVKAAQQSPQDRDLRKALVMQRDLAVADLITQAETLKAAGRKAELAEILARLEQAAPTHPRVAWLRTEVARTQRHERLMKEGQQALDAKSYEKAEAALRAVLSEDPGNALARSQLARIDELREAQTRRQGTLQLAMADKPVTLEFREASLRTVFEALARAADVNFVFDKDVRSDAKVTLYLKGTTVEEAMRVILNTQQLGYKLLNDNTVLVFPATQQKQRDVLDTVTRTFYLTNADPKQAQTLIRTVAKSRDVFVDERLNLVVVRDTPEVIRLVDRLMQSIDIADPEVMMEIEVMEISKSDSETLGIKWPTSVSYGLADGSTQLVRGAAGLTSFTTNPLAVASLTASGSDTKILANPKIRARNREKAKVVLAEKLPVFSTTSTPINGGVSNATAVSYVDVGLKLEVEPQVQLDDDVTIKVALEVSSITNTITSPDKSSVAYQVGTRLANTTLRLRDGETQVLAGLINDTESHSTAGLPYLHDAPLVSRLFGVTTDERKKTEIVMLLTPHIVRNVVRPANSGAGMQSGTETQPGASPMSLRDGASSSGLGGSAGGPALNRREQMLQSRAASGGRAPQISGPEEVLPGSMFVISVRNPDSKPLTTNLSIDTGFLVFDGPNASGNRMSLTIPPFGQQQVTLLALGLATEADTQIELDTGAAPLTVHIKPAQALNPDGNTPTQPAVPVDPPN